MKKSVLIRAALLCLLAVPAAGQVPAGPQEKMPLDGEVRVGRLDNGMTYYIRHYDNPRQRADFFIAHDVGALQEEDDQNGLAHFLEHMAFNGRAFSTTLRPMECASDTTSMPTPRATARSTMFPTCRWCARDWWTRCC